MFGLKYRFGKNGLSRILAASFMGFMPGLSFENTNIPGYDELYQFFDHNRLRAELTVEHSNYTDFSAKIVVDNETLYREEPGSVTSKFFLYRAYLQYSGSRHFWIVGKQRIPLGVGHFWNPIDVFNPINIESIEPDERPGTETIRYEYALSDLSNIDINIAKGKGAVRIKGYLEFADIALIGLWDEENDQDIIGWEVEGELGSTGIELRSEGGNFHNRKSGQRYTDFIIGAEYGFAGSLVLTGEYHSMGETGRDEIGISANFQPGMLWICSLLNVTEFEGGSGFVGPAVEYSLSDETTLRGGAFLYYGADNDYYGHGSDRYYLRWFVHF